MYSFQMLAAYSKLLTGGFFGRNIISSRGNYLLPQTAKHLVPHFNVSPVPFAQTHGDKSNPAFQTSTTLAEPIPGKGSEPRLPRSPNVLLSGGRPVHTFLLQQLLTFRELRHLCSSQSSLPTMPALKKGKMGGSVKDLILGKKKKNKNKKDEEIAENGGGDEVDGASDEPRSPDSTSSDVANPDADSTIAESDHDEEENAADEEEQEAEPEEEAVAAAEEPAQEDTSTAADGQVELSTLVKKLENFAPLSLAEEWDNVGLLVEPASDFLVTKIFLTNDLTEEVLEEAIANDSNFIISYHPPIFSPLKRLTMRSAKERIIVKAIEKGIAIYSPHTAHDATRGGVNDWLISAFGNKEGSAILCNTSSESRRYKVEVGVKKQFKQKVQQLFTVENGSLSKVEKRGDGSYLFKAICSKATLVSMLSALNSQNVKRNTQIVELFPDPCNDTGMGRFVTLLDPFSIEKCIEKVKAHLEIEHVQLALGQGKTLESSVESVAVCAGSGGTVLGGTKADLYLTGEMSHHEVLAAVANGTTVITCNHSNTERGFLKDLKKKLNLWLGDVPVQVSEVDADPLMVV